MAKKLNQIEVLNIIKTVHGELYDYSNLTYKSSRTKVELICRIHGSFFSALDQLKRGHGCPICGRGNAAKQRRVSFDVFLVKANEIQMNKYQYDRSSYTKMSAKVKINCPEHGWFEQNADAHVNGKQGCPICGKAKATKQSQKRQLGIEVFLERSRKIHGYKYDYSKVNYVNQFTKVTIICPSHDAFDQQPQNHLTGSACQKCAIIDQHKLQLKGVEEFIQDSILVHGEKYDYSQVDYQGGKKMVKLICPKHGEFYQTPNNHQRGNGCPNCNSSKGEEQIKRFLESHQIAFIQQHTFPELKDRRLLKCDFYLPDHKMVIEFHGRQHYEVVHSFGGTEAFIENQRRDQLKKDFLSANNIKFLEISYREIILEKLMEVLI